MAYGQTRGERLSRHQSYLDSASFYKATDIEKSIDFIAHSISELGDSGNKRELALSLSFLGEIYQYHQQYDLAITNYRESLETYKTSKTTLLLGEALVLNGEYKKYLVITR